MANFSRTGEAVAALHAAEHALSVQRRVLLRSGVNDGSPFSAAVQNQTSAADVNASVPFRLVRLVFDGWFIKKVGFA